MGKAQNRQAQAGDSIREYRARSLGQPMRSNRRLWRTCLTVGGIFGCIGVFAGALGAHALKGVLPAQHLESYETAVRYQLLHALALVAVGVLAYVHPAGQKPWADRALALAAWAFGLGTILFSGGIYGWLASGEKLFVHVVPVGGVLLGGAWLALAAAGVGLGRPHTDPASPVAR